eukprot:3290485-Amphidinium_carterae.2
MQDAAPFSLRGTVSFLEILRCGNGFQNMSGYARAQTVLPGRGRAVMTMSAPSPHFNDRH